MKWIAYYSDGEMFEQIDENGVENSYSAIDRSRLVSFAIVSTLRGIVYELHLESGQSLIWRRRVWIMQGAGEESRQVVHIVGWQHGEQCSIAFIFPDGHIEHRSSWVSGHPWADPPELMDCERIAA